MKIRISAPKCLAKKLLATVAGLVLIYAGFGLATAQQQPAGVVTGVQGQAQVTRPAAQPSPLRFRDGVVIRDVVDTREKSLARILFGGRSTVTVRELSRLEVREELLPTGARRDVHDLASGAILVNVARQLMKPGDEVIIRTPNAVAAIRGSTVFGSFNPVLNQSFFAILSGSGSVTPQGAPPITLTANTSNNGANVTGSGPAVQVNIVNVPPAQANQIIAESQVAKVVKEEANKEQNVQAAAKEAAALANAVIEAVTKSEQTTGETKTEEQKQEEQKQEQQEQASTGAEPTSETTEAPVTADTSSAVDQPDVEIAGTTKTLSGSETLKTFSGTSERTGTTPVVKITDSTINRASTGSLVLVDSGADATIGSPLLVIKDSTINDSQLLDVKGKLTGKSTEELIQTDPTTIKSNASIITVGAGGNLTVAGQLLSDVGGTFTALNDFLAITGGGKLTGNSTSALLQFDNSDVTVGTASSDTHFFRVSGSGSKATLKGPLMTASNSSNIEVKGFAGLEIFNSGILEGTSTLPLVQFTGGTLKFGSDVNALFMGSSGTATLSGGLFKATSATITLPTSVPFLEIEGGSSLTVGGSFLDLSSTTLDLGTQPLAKVTEGSTFKTTGGPAIKLNNSTLKADVLLFTDGDSNNIDFTGTPLDFSNSTVTVGSLGNDPSADNDTFKFTLAANEPFIKMANSKLELTGTTGEEDGLIFLEPDETGSTFKGLALVATDSSTLTLPHGLLSMEGVFESTSTQPLVQLTDSTVTNTGDLIFVEKFGSDPTEVTLAGQLLKASGSTIKVKNEDVNTVNKTVTVGSTPFDAAFAGGRAYVVNFNSGTVSIINTRTNTLEKTLTVGSFPSSIIREGSNIYVVNAGSNTVSRIDAITNAVTNTISVGSEPRDVTILPNNDKAYVTNFSGDTVSVIRTSDNTVIKTISVGDGPEGIDFSPDGKKVGVLNQNAGTVSIIDTSTDTVTATITVGTKPVDGAFTLSGDKAYVVNKDSDNVSVINVATNSFIKNIAVGDGPDSIAITPNSKKAYVGNEFSDTVSVIDIATDTVVKTISVGDEPDSIAISPDGKRAYVTNFASNTVKVINTESDTVIATVNVGTGPGTIALTRGGTIAFVLNEDSNNTSIVDTIDVGTLLAISGGAILKSTSTLPLLQFNPSTLEIGGNVVSITGSGSKLELAGALVSGEDTKFDVRRILRVRDGGVLTSTTTGALMEFTGTAADKSKVTTLFALASIDQLDTTDKAPSVSLAGPFLKATKTTFSAEENSIDKSNLIIVADGALLKSTGTDPLIIFDNSTLKPARGLLRIETPDSAGTGAKIEVAGPLLSVKNSSTFTTEADFISVRDKATLKGTGTTPLIQSSSSTYTIGSDVQGFGSFFRLDDNTTVTSNGGATVDLAGPLFQDTGSTFDIITRFLYVTGSSTLTSTSADPLMRFTDGTVDTDRNFIGVFDTSTLETKALLKATNTDFTAGTSDNDNSFLFVGSSSTLKDTGTDPFVIFETGSTLDTAGNFLTIRDSNSSTAPSTVSLAGPLLKATDGTFKTASCCSFLFLGEGGKLDGTGTGALFQLTNSTFNVGFDFVTVADSSPTTAKMDLKGALVSDSGSTFTIGSSFLRVRDGSTLSTTSTDPLISLSGSTVDTKSNFIMIDDSGSKVTLSGSLLKAGSTLNIGTDAANSADLLDINNGGQLVLTSTSSPVIEFIGGTHTVGTSGTAADDSNNSPNRIVRLVGVNMNTTTGLGTDQPIKGPASTALTGANNPIGTLLKATNAATIEVKKGAGEDTSGGNAVRIDTALYEATLPILDLVGSSTTETTLKTAESTISIFKSKVVSQGPVVAMDKSFINVTNGAFINVTGGSEWKVTGDLLKLFNGAKIEVINGPLILVSGTSSSGSSPPQSLLDVSGALVNFGGSGNNKIIVNNTLCSSACALKGGSGVQAIQVKEGSTGSITIGSNPIKNSSLGTITYQGSNTALIQTGSSGKVNITAP